MKKLVLFLTLAVLVTFSISGQNGKKKLDHDAIAKWLRITENVISPDGKYIAYKLEPWEGDTEVYLYSAKGEKMEHFNYASGITITSDSKNLLFKTITPFEEMRELKRKKTKKDQLPGDVLNVYNLSDKSLLKIEDIIGYKTPAKWGGYLAYQAKVKDPAPDKDNSDTKPEKKESAKNGYDLRLLNLASGEEQVWPFVKSYLFVKESKSIVFVSSGDNNEFKAGLYYLDIEEGTLSNVLESKGEFKNIVLTDDGKMGAFLHKEDAKPKTNKFDVYKWNKGVKPALVVSDDSEGIPAKWVVSGNGSLSFSNAADKLFFGTAPSMPEIDTMRIDDEYPDVDIWHGTEAKLHTVQVLTKSRDERKSYRAVYHISSGKIVQLENEDIPTIQLMDRGDSRFVLGQTNVPYALQTMWEGSPRHLDIYLINTLTGVKKLLKKDIRASVQISPTGNFLVWYDYINASYFSYSLKDNKEYKLTSPETVSVANELTDVPNLPGPYRPAGWLEDDKGLLISDRYDIWKLDLRGGQAPVNMTVDGRKTSTTYSYVSFDREARFIRTDKPLFLTGRNEITRASMYYTWDASKAGAPKFITGGDYSLSRPIKAKDAGTVVYTMSTFEMFPDLLVTDMKFKKSTKISDANPQQSEYLWGTAELVEWVSLDGRRLEGLLYKPENFDPSKKYPMIANFYEKSSQGLFDHRTPQLHRSTIDYHYYTSNGYVVFNPDIYYEDGYPGESAFNCVMPGITSIINMGFVDKDKIGAQGHSWGGYQVAYLATRTDLFAAIESGAPVVNMFSAYGGIRWSSGLNRSFQYEHTQSRIGATIWESPLRYLENSPLFTMDKVTTPILIMHNDHDGAVPWYQGIEFFIALRRLQKPVWMLNYVGADHWPQKFKNKKDFQIRMAQFFDHYLKDELMPVWMKEGVPVIKKKYDLGYELVKEK